MCGTCRFCLGFFYAAGFCSAAMLILITFIHYLYGGMPPIYAYTAGFWLQFTANITAMYLVLLIMRTIGRGVGGRWVHKYALAVLVIIVILYAAGSAFMFVSVSRDRMISYSRAYFKWKKTLPPFLDKFQYQYNCCGIRNYNDYNDLKLMSMRVEGGYTTTRIITPADKSWYIIEYLYSIHDQTAVNKTTLQRHYGFAIPQSCCAPRVEHLGASCGKYIEYGIRVPSYAERVRFNHSATLRVNNPKLGCYEKYTKIIQGSRRLQLPWLMGLMRWGALVLAIVYLILLWVYNVTIRTTRKDKRGELILDLNDGEKFGDDEDSMMAAIRRGPSISATVDPSTQELSPKAKVDMETVEVKSNQAHKNRFSTKSRSGRERISDETLEIMRHEARNTVVPGHYIIDMAKQNPPVQNSILPKPKL